MCEVVKANLVVEMEMEFLIKHISKASIRAEIITRIMRYVPCVLHCKNRCGLKILGMLLVEGLSNTQARNIVLCSEDDTIKKREDRYI